MRHVPQAFQGRTARKFRAKTARRTRVAAAALVLLVGGAGALAYPGYHAPVGGRAATVAPITDAAKYMPDTSLVSIRLREPDTRATSLRQTLERTHFLDSPAGVAVKAEPGFMQFKVGLLGLAAAADMDGWAAIGSVLGRDAVIGLYNGSTPEAEKDLLAVTIARDEPARRKFIDAFCTTAGLTKGDTPDPARSRVIGGHQAFTIAPRLHFATFGDVLVLSSSMDLLTQAMSEERGAAKPLSASEKYTIAMKSAPASAAAVLVGDATLLADAIHAAGKEMIDNPLAGFLFGGWMSDVLDAKQAVAWAEDLKDSLKISALVDAKSPRPESHRGFLAVFEPPQIQWPGVTLPGQIAEISLPRNWSELFSEREKILTLPAASQAAAFAATLTTLMGQIDFLEDFLPRVNGPVRLILVRQEFEGRSYSPSPKLPGFAIVAPLKGSSDEAFSQRLFSGSQMAMSFINYDLAQKQKPGLVMNIGDYRGVKVLRGEYAAPKAKPATKKGDEATDAPAKDSPKDARTVPGTPASVKAAPVEYNFEPTSAVLKDYFIVATSRPMLHSMIDALLDAKASSAPKPAESQQDRVSISGPTTLAILRDNREEMIAGRMLEKDEPRAKAEAVIDGVLAGVEMIDSVQLTSAPTGSRHRAEMTVKIKPWKGASVSPTKPADSGK